MKQITTDPGAVYCVYTTSGCTVTDTATGCTLMTAEPGQPNYFAATGHSVTLSDADATCLRPRFKSAPAALGLLGGGDKLPAGYTRVEFLESTGTQYIDTLLKPVANMSIRTKLQVTYYIDSSDLRGAVGTYYNSEQPFIFMPQALRSSNYIAFCSWAGWEGNIINKYERGVPFLLELKDKNVYVNEEPVGWSYQTAISQKEGSSSYLLFAIYNTKGALSISRGMRCYELKDSVGESVRCSLLPALDPTGTPCMYDRVSKTAFKNNGTGQFIAGVSSVAQLTTLLRNLPTTGGELTLSLPAEANTPEVAEQLQSCHDTKGWTLTVQEYRPAAVATYSLRRVREVVWCRVAACEHGSYANVHGVRYNIEHCAAIFGPHGQDPTAYGFTPFDSVEAAAEQWELTPYIAPDEEQA